MKNKKNLFIISLCLLFLTTLTGCEAHTPFVRIEERIMVQLVGIDIEDGDYVISVQFSMGKTSDGGKTENDLKTITGTGANMYSALRDARASVGKDFFFSHNQALFLGEDVIKNNAAEAIEGYLNYCDNYSLALVAGVYGKAEALLSLTYKDEYTGKNKLRLILENASDIGIYPVYSIYEVLIDAYSEAVRI